MREPALVGDCVAAMRAAVEYSGDGQMPHRRRRTRAARGAVRPRRGGSRRGRDALIVHARKAWLEGLSPKDNRSVPPLDYPLVYELKAAHPDLPIAINGGIADLAAAQEHLEHVDGAMFGRAAYQNPELLIDVDPRIFGEPAPFADAFEALEAYFPYVARELERGARLHDMTRHLVGLFSGRPGARAYRQRLAMLATRPGAGLATLSDAVAAVSARAARRGGMSGADAPSARSAPRLTSPSAPAGRARPNSSAAVRGSSCRAGFRRARPCARPARDVAHDDRPDGDAVERSRRRSPRRWR